MELKQLYRKIEDKKEWFPVRLDGVTYGKYAVNKLGEIYSFISNRQLSRSIAKNGYRMVTLHDHNNPKNAYVHRIVADTFIPITEDDIKNKRNMINHIDGDKTNNDIDNLERVNCLENNRHAHANGLISKKQKLYLSIKPNIIHDLKYGNMTYADIERKYSDYGISSSQIITYAKENDCYRRANNTYDPKYKQLALELSDKYPNKPLREIAKMVNDQSDVVVMHRTIIDWIRRYRKSKSKE